MLLDKVAGRPEPPAAPLYPTAVRDILDHWRRGAPPPGSVHDLGPGGEMDDQAYAYPVLWWYRIIPPSSKVQGWKTSPTHSINQDLSTVWLLP